MNDVEGRVSFHRYAELPGVEELRADDCSRHWRWYHTDYSVCTPLRFDGFGEYFYRGHLWTADALHQPLMEPGEVHATRRQTAPATFRVLFLSSRLLHEATMELGLGGGLPHLPAAPLANAAMMRAFRRLHACLESSLSTVLERQSRLAECVSRLLRVAVIRQAAVREASGDSVRVRRAREYLEANACRAVSLDDLAALDGTSRFHVAREFAAIVGVPPHAYQLVLRVARVRRLLSAGASIEDAARDSGFVDASHLGKHFKRLTAVTPGVYLGSTRRGGVGQLSRGGRQEEGKDAGSESA